MCYLVFLALIYYVDVAIDTKFFTPVDNLNSPVLQLTTIARLHWKKGLEYTLEALALLKQSNIPFHYSIIGDGIEKERLVFACYQLNLRTVLSKYEHERRGSKFKTCVPIHLMANQLTKYTTTMRMIHYCYGIR